MDATPTRRRPWYRLHLSTYFVLLIPLSALVLVGVPGYTLDFAPWIGSSWGEAGMLVRTEHGWPLVHLDRVVAPGWPEERLRSRKTEASFRWASAISVLDDGAARGLAWGNAANWKQTGDVVVMHKAALAINLLVAVAICAAIAAPYEWWRRRRFQYSLRGLLVLFVVAAAVFGWGRWQANERKREAAVIEQLSKLHCDVGAQYWGPVWLARLVGWDRFPILHRPEYIYWPVVGSAGVCHFPDTFPEGFSAGPDGGPSSSEFGKMLERAAGLPTVSHFYLYAHGDIADANWEQLARLKSLEEVCLDGNRISDFGVACLAKLPNLRRLFVQHLDEATRAKLQKALPKCRVEDLSDSG
ncbi:MAG: hypothetical protein ACLQLG_09750 [Thermoguttaceae bacterium]